MAVRLPSDLIADVMQNADPGRRGLAVARLRTQGTTDFAGAMESMTRQAEAGPRPVRAREEPVPPPASSGKNGTEVYQGFERMVLRNLFETLLPDEESGAFGGGPSAGIWRSMAAEQLAGVYVDSGGIGLGKMLASAAQDEGPRHSAQWPYFAMDTIGSVRG